MFIKLKKAIKRFLDKVAKQNEALYGEGKMNCCDLNKSTKSDKR